MPSADTFAKEKAIFDYRDGESLFEVRLAAERLFVLRNSVVDLTMAAFLP